MVSVIYRYKTLQENENMIRIIILQFRFVLLLVRREGRENKEGFSGNSISVLDGFLEVNLD